MKTFNSEFRFIGAWSTAQNSKPLEIEYKIKITLVMNLCVTYIKNDVPSAQPRDRIFAKGHGFLSFNNNMGKNVGKKT